MFVQNNWKLSFAFLMLLLAQKPTHIFATISSLMARLKIYLSIIASCSVYKVKQTGHGYKMVFPKEVIIIIIIIFFMNEIVQS